jgi:hypothetical protein
MGTPSRRDIVIANLPLLDTLDLQLVLDGFRDEIDCLIHTCWACGRVYTKPNYPNRVHVIARSKGGPDVPSNYWFLCERCHMDQPDGMDVATQIPIQCTMFGDVKTTYCPLLMSVDGATMDDVGEWCDSVGRDGIKALVHAGSSARAGAVNGWANAVWNLRRAFAEWLKTRCRDGDWQL